jgi:Protein of unknown function (DUF3800)
MSIAFEPADIGYIAYIDEAGDPGLTRVRPIDTQGATEWLSIGAILIQAERERDTVTWVKSIRQSVRASRGPGLHFRELNADRRLAVCRELIALPVKGFVVLSNKKNMLQYRNERVERARPSSQEWFYNWCIKLLLERITDFVEYNSTRRFGAPRHVRLVFSERGGVRYGQTKSYHDLARAQARSNTTRLTKRVIKWRVLHPSSTEIIAHTKNAGVQLADTIASSFYQAANAGARNWNSSFAETLCPIMPTECGACADYSVTLFPHWRRAKLTADQQKIFRFYGYPLRE